jgi:hypothetical protein
LIPRSGIFDGPPTGNTPILRSGEKQPTYHEPGGSTTKTKHQVLVADDDDQLCALVRATLELEGIEVSEA